MERESGERRFPLGTFQVLMKITGTGSIAGIPLNYILVIKLN